MRRKDNRSPSEFVQAQSWSMTPSAALRLPRLLMAEVARAAGAARTAAREFWKWRKRNTSMSTACRGRKSRGGIVMAGSWSRSEEHTSELQSRFDLVCRLLLEKKKEAR